MKHPRIASTIRARAHRKMAFSALKSDSSLSVNRHMAKACALENREVAS